MNASRRVDAPRRGTAFTAAVVAAALAAAALVGLTGAPAVAAPAAPSHPALAAPRTEANTHADADPDPNPDTDTDPQQGTSTARGLVLGADGRPVRDAQVTAFTLGADGSLVRRGGAVSSASGAFQIDGLPIGAVHLQISGLAAYPTQFLGGSPDARLATPLTFTSPGSSLYREVRLVTGGSLTGYVRDVTTGKPIAGILVSVSSDGGEAPRTALTTAAGVYSIAGLRPGSYDVRLNADGSTPAGAAYGVASRTVLVADRAAVRLDATLSPARKVSGLVTSAAGARLGGVEVRSYLLPDMTPGPVTTTDATGAYALYLQSGDWAVFVTDPQRRGASGYLGFSSGTVVADWLDSQRVKVAKAPIAVRTAVLPTATGGIDVGFVAGVAAGTDEPDPAGYVSLETLMEAHQDVVNSEWVGGEAAAGAISAQFPIRNVPDGDYRLTFFATSARGAFGGTYPARQVLVQVAGGAVTTIPEVQLGEATLFQSDTFPQVVPGFEPSIVLDDASGDGLPQVDESLHLDLGSWTLDGDKTYFVQWLRNGRPIAGATGLDYLLAPGDARATISVQVGAAIAEQLTRNFSFIAALDAPVEPGAAPQFGWQPAPVTGSPRVGATLTASPGSWSMAGLTYSYAWLRDGQPIAGATKTVYKPVAADVGQTLSVRITASRTGYAPGVATIDLGAVTPAAALKLVKAGVVTTASGGWRVTAGTWTPAPTSYSYAIREYSASGFEYVDLPAESTTATAEFTGLDLAERTTRVTILVTAHRAGYLDTTVELIARLGPTPVYETPPTLLGADTPRLGVPLTVDPSGALSSPVGAIATYQWMRGTTAIAGAKAATYVPVAADLGKLLTVRITLRAVGYAAPTATQFATLAAGGVVLPAAAIVPGGVSATGWTLGEPAVGRAMKVAPFGWAPAPTAYAYQWMRNGVAIAKATLAAYTPVAADAGTELSVRITGSRAGHPAGTKTVPVGTVVVAPLQSVVGPSTAVTAPVGVKLTATAGTWDLPPTALSYQWYRNGTSTPIVGATLPSYTPAPADLGDDLFVVVTAKRAGFGDGRAETAHVTVTPGAAITSTAAPAVTVAAKVVTTAKAGQTLTATPGTWPVTGLALSYQWQVDATGSGLPTAPWADVAGATERTLLLDPELAVPALRYRVVVTAARTGYLPAPPAVSASVRIVP